MALSFIPGGRPMIFGSSARMPSTTAIVLAPPCLRTGMYTEGCPSISTTLY